MKSPIRVLHLEDSARDAELIKEKLELGGLACNIVLVNSREGFESAMAADSFDLILCDHNLPGYGGRSAIKLARERLSSVPIISLSGAIGEEEAVECLKLGATDYVLKKRLDRLVPAVRRGLREAGEHRARLQAEKELRASEEQFRAMFDMASVGIAQADPRTGRWLSVNPKMCEITGYSASELLQMRVADITQAEDRQPDWEAFQRVVRGEAGDYRMEKRYVRKDGSLAWVNVNMTVLRDAARQPARTMATIEDITERKRTELRIAAFANLGQRLNSAKTAREAGEIIVAVADELLGWDACLFDLYSAAEDRVSHLLSMDLIDGRRTECKPRHPNPLPRGFSRRAIDQGGQLILRDQPKAVPPEGSPFGDISRPSASIMFVPIRHGTEVVGVLSIQSYAPRAYDADNLETLQTLADYAGGALERLRSQEALGDSETTFRSVWERSIDGMRLTDKEGRIIAVNQAFCQLVKLPRKKLEGQFFPVAYTGQGPSGSIEIYQQRFSTTDVVPRITARAQLWNGKEADLEISNSFVELGRRGRMLLSIFRDVSERKRAEMRIEVFSQLGQRLSAVGSPAEAARAIYASADQFWKWDSGVLDLQVPESRQMETALAYDLADGQRREVTPPIPVGTPSAMFRRVMAQGAELILRKPDEPPATDTIRFGDACRPSASLMCVPVRAENRAVGVLSIQSYTPNAYTPEDLRTLQALADHCSGALDRLRMEGLLRASEIRYRRLFEAAKDGVLVLDAETGTVEDVNPFLAQMLGLSKEALLGKKIWELRCFKDIVANVADFEKMQQAEYIQSDDKPLEAADGRRIDVEFVTHANQVGHQKVIQCHIRNITERKLTEWRALIYKDQLRALSARIEALREEERTRISREIHDELGQMLTGIKMDLRWMEHRLDEFGDDRRVNPILDKLVATAELIDATAKTVQRIAAELRPGLLDKLGLPTALQYEGARFEERTGIACRLVVPGETSPLPPEVATAFFRIFQEALTNVVRHAKATAVEAELQPEADGCRLEIRDNGQGMAGVDLANLKSLGLLGMHERASLLGGGVSFAPRPGGGTVVTARIPNRPTAKGGA